MMSTRADTELELARLRARVDRLEQSLEVLSKREAAMRTDIVEPLKAVERQIAAAGELRPILDRLETMIDLERFSLTCRELVCVDKRGRPVVVVQGDGATAGGGLAILNQAGLPEILLTAGPEGGTLSVLDSTGGEGRVSAAVVDGSGTLIVRAADGDAEMLDSSGHRTLHDDANGAESGDLEPA